MRVGGRRAILAGLVALAAIFLAAPGPTKGGERTAANSETPLRFHIERNVPFAKTVESICCETGRFKLPAQDRVIMGFNGRALWLRIELVSEVGIVQLKPILDDVTMYFRTKDGSWKSFRTGDQLPVGIRPFESPFMAFPIPRDIAGRVVFVRVVQPTAIAISAFQWTPSSFAAMQARDHTIKAFLFGFVCAMVMLNCVISVLVRDYAFLLNACAISGILLTALYLSGYGAVYFWPSLPGWSNTFFVISLVIAVVAGSLFMWVFIKNPDESAWRNWPILAGGALAAIAGIGSIVLPYYIINLALLVSAAVQLLGSSVFLAIRAWDGDRRARILLFPVFLAIVPGTMLVALDKLFDLRPLAVGNNGLEITLCLEALLFSLALTSRIRLAELNAREASMRLLAFREESAARTVQTQDAERRRLASELHDGVGQGFLLVLNGLKHLTRLALPASQKVAISGLANIAGTALDDLRRISRDMHPSSVEHLGLKRALEGMVGNLATDSIETKAAIEIDENTLPSEVKLHAYRIVQECLANTIRHAGATRVSVSAVNTGGILTLAVEDDGIGLASPINPEKDKHGLGFTSIDERVRILNGHWTVGESDTGGLAIRVHIPIPSRRSEV